MGRRVTMAGVKRRLELAASSIKRLTLHQLKKGKPVSWGVLTPPAPNTTLGRTPNPFSGGN